MKRFRSCNSGEDTLSRKARHVDAARGTGSASLSLKKQFFNSINPSNEEIICSIPRSTYGDVDLAVKAAHQAFQGPWSLLTPFDRGQLLFKFADILEKNSDKLSHLESIDVGKPKSEAKGDIEGVVNQNDKNSFNYGLNPKSKKTFSDLYLCK